MTDILRRELAPVTDEAWGEIDGQAKRILKGNLSARSLVDVSGPHGWSLAAVNLGAVEAAGSEALKGVEWGLRQVLPLVEMRVPFSLGLWDLDNISRGGKTAALDAVVQAAQKAALFEEQAVYHGFANGGIQGMGEAGIHKPVALAREAGKLAGAVEAGIHAIQSSGIGGPFHLVLGRQPYQMLAIGDDGGYPLQRRIGEMLGGRICWSPAVSGGLVVSGRGGDFEITVGQDFSMGYHSHGQGKVNLYVTESFTFRVLEPAAAVELKSTGKRRV